MNLKQLYARLGKITIPDKLERFIRMANEYGYWELRAEAMGKLDNIRGFAPRTIVRTVFVPTPAEPPAKPAPPPLTKSADYKRAIDF